MAHRVTGKGDDTSGLGRWTWTTLRGKNNHKLTIISAYRPNPPSAGVMGVYAQQAKYFNSIGRDMCPRNAFIIDLKQDLSLLMEAGHHVILMLDSNEDMRRGPVSQALQDLQLQEVILERHGLNAPSTYRCNTNEVPIDGIWASTGIDIKAGGYFSFDKVISGTDHRTLWMDISYTTAFGHDGSAPIIRPNARRLNNRNPNVRDNFNTLRRKYAEKCRLLERIILLEESIQDEITDDQIKELLGCTPRRKEQNRGMVATLKIQ
jgi:hypothetical protein